MMQVIGIIVEFLLYFLIIVLTKFMIIIIHKQLHPIGSSSLINLLFRIPAILYWNSEREFRT
jgi:uncharacterized membrane protein YhaH (DUF805 family)